MTITSAPGEIEFQVRCDADILIARQQGRWLTSRLGFGSSDSVMVATAISELARNILLYAGLGQVVLTPVNRGRLQGLTITAEDHGDGIPDVELALTDGYSTSGRLGVGLPGVRRLMDEFDIVTEIGRGTVVTVTKWRPQHASSATRPMAA